MEDLPEKTPKINTMDKNESNLEIEFICAFYDKCTLPKNDSLCNTFPSFMICPDYKAKRNKLLHEK
ncbi:MAG: hypothetical protein ACFFDK_02960 [Promethearchaeota archaeon]